MKFIKNLIHITIIIIIIELCLTIIRRSNNKKYICESTNFEMEPINNIFSNVKSVNRNRSSLPPLYIITPISKCFKQVAELIYLGNTLKHVENLIWLVLEDATIESPIVTKTLKKIGVRFHHLHAIGKDTFPQLTFSIRNRGLLWIRANYKNYTNNGEKGAIHFADPHKTYDISIFEQMRYTKKISMWPVGLVTDYALSSPVVVDGNFIGFYDGWIAGREFPIDMAGFAFSVDILLSRPNAVMPHSPSFEEEDFLKSLLPFNKYKIELLANNCTQILSWFTRTYPYPIPNPKISDSLIYEGTNLVQLNELLSQLYDVK